MSAINRIQAIGFTSIVVGMLSTAVGATSSESIKANSISEFAKFEIEASSLQYATSTEEDAVEVVISSRFGIEHASIK